MSKRLVASPWLTAGLAAALLVSVGFHVGRWVLAPAGPTVLSLEREGALERPTIFLEFDRAMVAPARVGSDLGPDAVRLEPPVGARARFLTPRRLEIRPLRDLPAFTTCRVRFGRAFSDLEGRSVDEDAGVPLAFSGRRLDFRGHQTAFVDERGRAVARFELSGPVQKHALRAHFALVSDGRTISDFALEGSGRSWRIVLSSIPTRAVSLVLRAGLETSAGPEGLDTEVRRTLNWDQRLVVTQARVSGRHPDRVVTLSFSRTLLDEDAAPFIETDPPVKPLRVERRKERLVLTGPFPPRRGVTVRILSGLGAVGGFRLKEDVERRVTIPAPDARLDFAQSGRTLSTRARPEIDIRGLNVPNVEVVVHEVYANNVVPLALEWTRAARLSAPKVTRRVPIDAPLDEVWTRTLDLADLLGRAPRGIYRIELRKPESWWASDSRLLQVTDLAPVVRARADGTAVLVTRISDGTPVPDAEVRIFDKQNQPCGAGATDAEGLFVAGPAATEPFVVTVETGNDRAWVDLATHALAHVPRDVEGQAPVVGLEAYVWSDRGVVRPGETAHVGAVVRTPDGTAPPSGLPLDLILAGPDRRVLRRMTRPCDAHGVVAADLDVPRDAAVGAYRLEVRGPGEGDDAQIGETTFRVAAIVPDRIEPTLDVPAGPLAAGRRLDVRVAARLLTGDPAPDRRASLVVRYRPVEGATGDGFVFGDASDAPAPFVGPEAGTTLDEEGRGLVEVTLPDASTSGLPMNATFELSVVDVSGRASFARATRLVTPKGPRLALKAPTEAGFTLPVRLEGAASAEGEAILQRVTWEGTWVVERGRPRWRSEEIDLPVARVPLAVVDGVGTVTFPDPGDGTWRVRVEAPDCSSAAVRFARWDGKTSSASGHGGAPRLDLALRSETVRPTETATIEVDAPFAGRALLTVEGPSVLDARVVEIPAGRSTLEVEMPDAAGPDVYATLTLVRGVREAGEQPARLVGALHVPLHRPERRLDVTIEAPPEVLPGSTITLQVLTSEASTLRVHLVDEGILRLTGHETPSPRAHFGARRRLDTRLADAYTNLLERMRFGSDDPDPGGGSFLATRLDPTAKKTIETVVLASELLHCNGETPIEITFPLPSWEGRLRAFVVAAGTLASGASEASVVVKGPIGLQVHVPRAVAPGDEFEIAIDARGEGVALDVTMDGLERISRGLPLRVRALDRPGAASVTVRAQDASGNLAERTATMSIRPPAPFTIRHVVRELKAGDILDEALPGRWLGGTQRARITIGHPGPIELLPAMERLLEYPYGCVEQTISKAFPILAWSEIARLAHPEGARPIDTVDDAVSRLRLMQTRSGALATWPGGTDAYAFGSAYGAHFLVEARRLGRDVPDDLLDPLLDWLEGGLGARDADPYAARVLALAGRPVVPYLDALERAATGPEARAEVGAAWLLAGVRDRGEALIEEALGGDPWTTPRGQGGRLASPLRAASTILSALVAAKPDDPRITALERRIRAAVRRASANTTQENAAGLLALAAVWNLRRTNDALAHGVAEAGGECRRYDGHDPLVLEVLPEDRWHLRIEATGPTTVVLRLEGVPLDDEEDAPVDPDIEIRRTIVAQDGALKQGHVYEVVLEGVLPPGSQNVLLTDVLPGGLEIESAKAGNTAFRPDRVEPRDDRVLFFRTKPFAGAFRQTYLVRAVTPGTYALPRARVELLYEPETAARSADEGMLEITR